MDTCGMLRALLLCVGLFSVLCLADLDASAEESTADKDLMEALEALLGRVHSAEKRGSIPLCGMGSRCAMKFGPRIGKLCDCGQGANCNSYLLKCI